MRTSHLSTQFRPSRLRGWSALCAGIALSGTVALTPVVTSTISVAAAQQSTPAATPGSTPVASPASSPSAQKPPTVVPLMEYAFKDFPAAPVTIRLLRIRLAPGASVPMHTHPGPEFDRVESGVLTAQATGDAVISTSGATTTSAFTNKTGELKANDWILFPTGAGMMLANKGKSDVVLLSAVILPVGDGGATITYTDGTPTNADFDGVTFTVLGDGLLPTLPTGGATVTIDQVGLPAGTDLPSSQNPEMLSRIDGNFSFKLDSGAVQVSRSKTPGLQANAIPNSEFTLATGDAAFFPSGVVAASRASETAPLSFYRLKIQPSSALTSTGAVVSWETAAATPVATPRVTATVATPAGSPEPTQAATGTGIPKGTKVTVNTDGVNMRSAPSADAESVNQVDTGVQLVIVAGPEVAEGNTWYQVNLPEDPQGDWSTGWVAEQFFDAPNASGTPTSQATPSATVPVPTKGSPVAISAPYKEGDVVVTTDDNARVRTDPTVDADIVDAYPAGTAMTITGGAVKSDGYTWYPVEVVGANVIGWIASDLITLSTGQ